MNLIGKGRYGRETYAMRRPATPPNPGTLVSVDTVAVASASRLVEYNSAGLEDGTLAWVASISALWMLRTDSALTTDNITIVDALGLAGAQWHRFESDYRFFAQQAVWQIDPANGNDEKDGLTVGTALATFAELIRRWQFDEAELSQNTEVFIRGDLDPVLDARTRIPVKNTPYLRIIGVPTVLYSGTISAVTQTNPATNTQLEVTDAAMPDFSVYEGQRINFGADTAPGTQRLAWIALATGLTQARLEDATLVTTTPGAQARAAYVVAPEVAYRIESLPLINDLRLENTQRVSGNPAIWRTVVQDVKIQAGSFDGWGVGALITPAFVGCDIVAPIFLGAGETVFIGCRVYSGFDGLAMSLRRGTARCTGCLFDNGIDVGVGALLFTEVVGSLAQDYSISVSFGGMLSGTAPLGIFDSTVGGMVANPGSRVAFSSNIYGEGNQAYGWEHQSTAWATYTASPTVTGVLGDLFVAKVRFSDANRVLTWATAPTFTLPGNVVQRAVPTELIVAPALTITTVDIAVPGVTTGDTVIVRFYLSTPADLAIVGVGVDVADQVRVVFLSVVGFNDVVDLLVSILPGS